GGVAGPGGTRKRRRATLQGWRSALTTDRRTPWREPWSSPLRPPYLATGHMDFAFASVAARARLRERLSELWELTGDEDLRRLSEGQPPEGLPEPTTPEDGLDLVSTSLMRCFKNTEEPRVFAVLFALNHPAFLQAVHSRL